jgi:hypothetical protein
LWTRQGGVCCAVPGAPDRCEGTALLDQQVAQTIVAAWREVERDIAAVEPGSPEYVTLYVEARQLRKEYQRLIDEARTNLRPEPAPFPGS